VGAVCGGPLPRPLSQTVGRGGQHTPSPRIGGGLGWGLGWGLFVALSPGPSPNSGRGEAGCFDGGQHAFEIVEYLLVSKANDTIAILFELLCSGCILLRLQIVDVAVYFDHQAAGGTVKVGDKGAKGVLPPEFEPVQLLVPQVRPEQFFGRCHLLAQLAGALLDLGRGANAFSLVSHWFDLLSPKVNEKDLRIDGRYGGGDLVARPPAPVMQIGLATRNFT